MRVILDTNALIRFFTRDIEEKAQKVKKLLDEEPDIFISDVVFPELEYVLMKEYKTKREEMINYYEFLISKDNIKTTKELKRAVAIYKSTSLDMAHCIIAAHSQNGFLASFDKDLLNVESVKSYWK